MPFSALSFAADGDELVHAAVALRHGQEVLHAAEQIVGVEHGVLADAPQAVGAVRADVAVGADEDADVAEEARGRGRSIWGGCSRGEYRSPFLTTTGVGRYGASVSRDADRARAGAAAAVGAAEGFVGVVVLHVGAEIAGAGDAEDGVHVRAVEVDEAAVLVDGCGDVVHLGLEDADRVRVGDHEHGDLVVELAAEVVHVERAGGRASSR